jgi:hypothetical protein
MIIHMTDDIKELCGLTANAGAAGQSSAALSLYASQAEEHLFPQTKAVAACDRALGKTRRSTTCSNNRELRGYGVSSFLARLQTTSIRRWVASRNIFQYICSLSVEQNMA